ncbi:MULTISPECIES: hypothetical protein [Delftia]|uniref:Uncharacterized protein n=2 Tax=Delftia TaxID=80865 RepID=A0A7T2S5Q2_DELAC|nr:MULTISPECIES: hypothetical protein [Delftia]MBB1648684.1 hypothetical protein [Delftia sp. UME58]QPS09404.1 hypothetical protein I6G66_05075 [Delftia acidovorans]
MTVSEKIQDLRKWDDSRKGFTGEHWLVLGAGLLALRHARRAESGMGRLVSGALGTALIARAATGRDGVLGTAGRLAAKPTLAERLLIAARRL